MSEFIITTYDWVPQWPRGHVRDLRIRWALEEAGFPYRVQSVPFRDRGSEHFAHQPFGQVPWLIDGELSIFESGAIVLYLGERSPALLPTDPRGRAEAVEWVFGALNSMEMATVPWSMLKYSGDQDETHAGKTFDAFVGKRLGHLEAVLAQREWLAGTFSVADILMCEVLRLVERFDRLTEHPACREYIARATARPAFAKAYADQMAHFAETDRVESMSRG